MPFSESNSTRPFKTIFPLSGFSSPAIHLSVILFPDPEAPSKPNASKPALNWAFKVKPGLQVKGIDFIPLQTERYELVIKRDDMGKLPFETVVDILRSQEFKMELEGIGGYDLKDTGRIVAET